MTHQITRLAHLRPPSVLMSLALRHQHCIEGLLRRSLRSVNPVTRPDLDLDLDLDLGRRRSIPILSTNRPTLGDRLSSIHLTNSTTTSAAITTNNTNTNTINTTVEVPLTQDGPLSFLYARALSHFGRATPDLDHHHHHLVLRITSRGDEAGIPGEDTLRPRAVRGRVRDPTPTPTVRGRGDDLDSYVDALVDEVENQEEEGRGEEEGVFVRVELVVLPGERERDEGDDLDRSRFHPRPVPHDPNPDVATTRHHLTHLSLHSPPPRTSPPPPPVTGPAASWRHPMLVGQWPAHRRVTALAVSEDGRWVAVGFRHGGVMLIDLTHLDVTVTANHPFLAGGGGGGEDEAGVRGRGDLLPYLDDPSQYPEPIASSPSPNPVHTTSKSDTSVSLSSYPSYIWVGRSRLAVRALCFGEGGGPLRDSPSASVLSPSHPPPLVVGDVGGSIFLARSRARTQHKHGPVTPMTKATSRGCARTSYRRWSPATTERGSFAPSLLRQIPPKELTVGSDYLRSWSWSWSWMRLRQGSEEEGRRLGWMTMRPVVRGYVGVWLVPGGGLVREPQVFVWRTVDGKSVKP